LIFGDASVGPVVVVEVVDVLEIAGSSVHLDTTLSWVVVCGIVVGGIVSRSRWVISWSYWSIVGWRIVLRSSWGFRARWI